MNNARAALLHCRTAAVHLLKSARHCCTAVLQIGPGEVDKQLDGEVGEECSKYGAVSE